MTNEITRIADKFLAGKACTADELSDLKSWFSNPASRQDVEPWLAGHWADTPEIDSYTFIEDVVQRLDHYPYRQPAKARISISRFLKIYQRAAAFLLIPLLVFGLLDLAGRHRQTDYYTETIAPRGQKSQIILSDGTKVWLNSETKIRYPGNFSQDQRDVYLEGEAFFEVTKNSHRPFVVHTSELNVNVLGTKFNVKAYPDEGRIETSLFEGKVSLELKEPAATGQTGKKLKPGQSFVYDRASHQLTASRFLGEEINGWKKNQLIFKDDTFSNLVRKVERWYDVKIIYDEKQFNDRRLTVELYEGERLERLMEVISLTLSVDYRYENGKIILTPES